MAWALEDFLEAVEDELGEAAELVRDEQLIRWINRGRTRLGFYRQKTAALSWADGAASVALPADCSRVDRILTTGSNALPPHMILAGTLAFSDPDRVTAGTATLYYGAEWPAVTGSAPSTMPAIADEAVVSYVLARFFKRIAGIRSDFRRYVAITGQNGVDVRDLLDLATDHDRDYERARDDLVIDAPATFFSD